MQKHDNKNEIQLLQFVKCNDKINMVQMLYGIQAGSDFRKRPPAVF